MRKFEEVAPSRDSTPRVWEDPLGTPQLVKKSKDEPSLKKRPAGRSQAEPYGQRRLPRSTDAITGEKTEPLEGARQSRTGNGDSPLHQRDHRLETTGK